MVNGSRFCTALESVSIASGGYLSTVKHTALAQIEPTTFRLLVPTCYQ